MSSHPLGCTALLTQNPDQKWRSENLAAADVPHQVQAQASTTAATTKEKPSSSKLPLYSPKALRRRGIGLEESGVGSGTQMQVC